MITDVYKFQYHHLLQTSSVIHDTVSNNLFVNVFLFLSDPSSVNLEKVSNIIIDQSLKDQVFSKEAGRICYTIVQVHTVCSLIDWLSITI